MPLLLDEYMHAFAESHCKIANQHRRSSGKKKFQNSLNSQKSARYCNCCVKQLLSWFFRIFVLPRRCAAQWCHDAIFLGIQLSARSASYVWSIRMKPFSRSEFLNSQLDSHVTHCERWRAGVETRKNVRGEVGGWGRVPFNQPYAPSLSTIYDGA